MGLPPWGDDNEANRLRPQHIENRTIRLKQTTELTVDDEGGKSEALDIYFNRGLIHIGCVSIEPDAWRKLVKQVEKII